MLRRILLKTHSESADRQLHRSPFTMSPERQFTINPLPQRTKQKLICRHSEQEFILPKSAMTTDPKQSKSSKIKKVTYEKNTIFSNPASFAHRFGTRILDPIASFSEQQQLPSHAGFGSRQ